jgi:hypothetical protein
MPDYKKIPIDVTATVNNGAATSIISHIARGQWGAYERERQIKFWADDDVRVYRNYEVGIEQEPGSGGKESAENTVRNLVGYAVYVDKD